MMSRCPVTHLEDLLSARLPLEHGCDGRLVVAVGAGESLGELHEGHVAVLAPRRHQDPALVHLHRVQRIVRDLKTKMEHVSSPDSILTLTHHTITRLGQSRTLGSLWESRSRNLGLATLAATAGRGRGSRGPPFVLKRGMNNFAKPSKLVRRQPD